MSRRSVTRSRSAKSRAAYDPEPEAIALRIHQIAAAAGVIAEGQEPPISHAIFLLEASLLDVERRVERLRPMPA